jgi:ATP-dependent RNA helicase DDX10/DBP4
MLFLLPHETPFLDYLRNQGIEIRHANFNNKMNILGKARQILAKRPDIKHLATKYFGNYLKSIHLNPNKEIFDVRKISFDGLA